MAEVEVAEEYKTSLLDLKDNSKPMINMLTMLADENKSMAAAITKVIEERIVEVCLNILYINYTYIFCYYI